MRASVATSVLAVHGSTPTSGGIRNIGKIQRRAPESSGEDMYPPMTSSQLRSVLAKKFPEPLESPWESQVEIGSCRQEEQEFPQRVRTGDVGGLPNGYTSYDRRPVAICPSVTHNKEEREENKRKYV
jgi:hypothetical protein